MPGLGERREWRSAGRWSCLCMALFGLLLLNGGAAVGAESPVSKEYQIKAAFLYNFTRFIEWPPASFSDATDPIVIGVLGYAPLSAELERIVQGRRVNGRAVVVKRVEALEETRSVHLLFMSTTEEARFAAVAAAIEGSPVLTVGESSLFSQAGGIISFVLEDDKVRFVINIASAERTGLHISAQLQKLATAAR